MKIILASGSPRRKELLERFFEDKLLIHPAKGEEIVPEGAGPEETVRLLSRAKAQEVAAAYEKDDLIIAADTIVWNEGHMLGKPRDAENAAEMLKGLSGKQHEVYTGITIIKDGIAVSEAEMTKVYFRELSEQEIQAYIRSGEPMDKAGAYGIQGKGSVFVNRIEGDYFNVVGLPVCRLGEMLRKQGVELL